MAYFTYQKIINLTWNNCGPERAYHYSSVDLCGLEGQYVRCGAVRCGAVRALKIMLRGGCGPPQDNEVRCGCRPSLCGAVWVRAWNFSQHKSLIHTMADGPVGGV